MWRPICARFKFWNAVVLRRAYALFFVAPLWLISTFATLRDEFLPDHLAATLKTPELLSTWLPRWVVNAAWYWWVMAALIATIIFVLEGSYREHTKLLATFPKPDAVAVLADMPIQEVVLHIDADVLENQTWETVGQTLLDSLALGVLSASGREMHFGPNSYVGFPNLALIPQAYWKTAQFTYEFFGEDVTEEVHVRPRSPATGPDYRDVRFNSSEIKSRWEKSSSQDRIAAIKAMFQILTQSEWARTLAADPDKMPPRRYEQTKPRREWVKERLLVALRRDIHDRLRNGEVEAWGRKSRHKPLTPIQKEEWDNIQITSEPIDFSNLENGFCTQNMPNQAVRTTCYENVQFVRSKLFKIYPLRRSPFQILDDGRVIDE